jgi:hypothetical protein
MGASRCSNANVRCCSRMVCRRNTRLSPAGRSMRPGRAKERKSAGIEETAARRLSVDGGICRQSVKGLAADRCCKSLIKRPPEGS